MVTDLCFDAQQGEHEVFLSGNFPLVTVLQETFEKFKDYASELGDKNEMMSFVLGFKLGMRVALEAMIGIDEITEPKMN